MNINAINNQAFGANVNVLPQSKNAKFFMNLEEKLFKIDPNTKQSIMSKAENYADRHGIKEVNLILRKAADNVRKNEHGDLLLINCGSKTTAMRFDNTTTSQELSATILGNIQDNSNLIHPRRL